MSALTVYLTELRAKLATGDATEHTHRSALQRLLEGLLPGMRAINEPRHTDAGAVDFIVKQSEQPIGWVEAKDIGADLGKVAKGEQLKRYLGAYPNLILTDYVSFRLYLNGKMVEDASLGAVDGAKITSTTDKQGAVEALLRTFLSQEVYRAGKPEDLARRMAYFARMAEAAIIGALKKEGERGQLHSQMAAFRETLLPDLTEEQFADMYAQTVAYGLFAAKCHHPLGDDFSRWTAAKYLPPTNPFLQRLFHELTGPDLDPEVEWVVDGLVSLLRNTEMQAIVEAFAKHQQGREDPVVHFYETFLKEYNPKERKIRGVYYTPEPVVSYIVRSVDHLLKTEFDKPLGLADDSVFILDPACGTGTFLYFVIEHIHNTVTRGGQDKGAWPGYVRDKLLKRVFGFELLMAPYTIAHLKLAELLKEQGYDFPDDQRLGIYLTNTLEEARFKSETLVQRYISEEAEAAAEVKRDKPIMVVLGNPPYAGHSANKGEWIGRLVRDYYSVDGQPLGERNPKWLQDDYVKFVRFGQWRIEQTGHGVLAFITNHGYLDNPTFRGMRQQLMRAFSRINVLDLHGSMKKKEVSPDRGKDENVFDIQSGVAIGLFRGLASSDTPADAVAEIKHAELWGGRQTKYEYLDGNDVNTTTWENSTPTSPFYLFPPSRTPLVLGEYLAGVPMTAAMPVHVLGFQTHRDHFAVGFGHAEMHERFRDLQDRSIPDQALHARYSLSDNRDWQLRSARESAISGLCDEHDVVPCLYRPLDVRQCIFSTAAMDYPRRELQQHVHHRQNLSLLTTRQIGTLGWRHVAAADCVAESCVVSTKTKEQNYVFPLYLYPDDSSLEAQDPRRPNLAPTFTSDLAARLGLTFIEDGRGDLGREDHEGDGAVPLSGAQPHRARERGRGEDAVHPSPTTTNGNGSSPLPLSRPLDTAERAGEGNSRGTFGPEDVFNYIYAVLHSPTYRSRYAEFLKIDFPRIPLTSNPALFRKLCDLGGQLVALHLLKSPLVDDSPATFPEQGSSVVEAVRYDEANRRVHINGDQYFGGIDKALYEFQVGGYQVMNKWLKDRKGRTLSYEDIRHYQQVAAALTHTMRLMREIDEAIPAWPIA